MNVMNRIVFYRNGNVKIDNKRNERKSIIQHTYYVIFHLTPDIVSVLVSTVLYRMTDR